MLPYRGYITGAVRHRCYLIGVHPLVIYSAYRQRYGMGLLRKETLSSEELQRIKERVENIKIDKNQQEPPGQVVKTDFVGNSQNLNDLGTTEMKLVKILNEIENLKGVVQEEVRKSIEETKAVVADIAQVRDLVRDVPREMLAEMGSMKKNLPSTYDGIQQSIGEHIRAKVVSAIDTNILKVIREGGRVNSTDLLAKIEAAHVCSKNTLYVHLSRLEDDGYLVKKREMHEVYYTLPDAVQKELQKQVSQVPSTPTSA